MATDDSKSITIDAKADEVGFGRIQEISYPLESQVPGTTMVIGTSYANEGNGRGRFRIVLSGSVSNTGPWIGIDPMSDASTNMNVIMASTTMNITISLEREE